MAKKNNAKPEEEKAVQKPKIPLKKYKLKDDFPPKKKGEIIELSKGGATLLKSKNLI